MHTYRLLVAILLLASSTLLRAQSNNPIGGHFGVKAGASLTRIEVSGISANIPKQALQPHLGLMYRYRYQRFVVQPEALLAVKGGTFQTERLNVRNTNRALYTYASVPVLLGYIPTEGLTLQAGPEFSYALRTDATNGPGPRNDFGVVVGVHYDFLDMLDNFSLHIRYVHGLTNVSPDPLATYKNRNIQVSAVYNLYKKRK